MASPVPGYKVTTPYGKPGSWAAGYHTGNDYAAPAETPVVATRAGTVTKAVWDGDYGNRVEVLTGDVEHSYSHLSAMSVWQGQGVVEGQQVGRVGSTGNSTGPHLHYEERLPGFSYSDDRAPQFDTAAAAPPGSEEDEDMFIVTADGRAPGLMAGGYFNDLNEEEMGVLTGLGVRVVHSSTRSWDVARSVMLHGTASGEQDY